MKFKIGDFIREVNSGEYRKQHPKDCFYVMEIKDGYYTISFQENYQKNSELDSFWIYRFTTETADKIFELYEPF